MDIKNSKASIKKTTPPSEWFKNVSKSIGYSSSEVIREITPNTYSFIADNFSYGKELVENVRDAKENSKSVAEMLNLGTQMNTLNTAVKNALDDIKSGKIYNKERAEAFDDDDEFSAFLSGDFDMGDESSSSSSSSEKPTIINNVKVTRDDNRLVDAVSSAAQANLQGTQALMKQNKDVASATISVNHQMGMQMTKGLETINTNISQLVNFQNDSMAKYIGASIQYYDDSLKVMKDSLDKLVMMAPAPTRDRKDKFNGYDAVFGGGSFNLQGYVENVKGNFGRMKDENMLVQAVTSFLGEQDTLDRLAKSPLTFISETVTKKLIPMAVRETVKQFDDSVTAFFPAMIDKFSRMGKGGNMFTETIGQLFGIDTSVKSSPNMSNYTRGAIPFDGETKRAITDVIPMYLRKIHSALSGGKEVAFSYETGKWDTVENMQKAYDSTRNGLTRTGYSSQIDDLSTMVDTVKFESEKQQKDFRTGMDKFLYELSRTTEQIAFDVKSPDRARENQEKSRELFSFGDPKMDKLLYSMMASLSKTQQMDLVGAGRYKNLSAMQNFFTEIEDSPTKHNALTLLSGMTHDEHVALNADGNIKKAKASGLNRLDKYGRDELYYLREIAGTLMQGIRVFTSSSNQGGTSPDFLNNRWANFSSQQARKQDVRSTNILDYDSSREANQNNIVMGDLEVSDDMVDKLRSRIEHKKTMEKNANSDKFGDTMRDLGFGGNSDSNMSKVKNIVSEVASKPAELLTKVFEKIDGTLYNIVFGIREDGKGSFMDRTLEKMTSMFTKVGDFATDRIFLPVSEFLLNTFDKVKNAAGSNPIVEGIKNGVKFWFVGEKDDNGKRQGGVFSEIMNSTWDMAKSINHGITGLAYTDSKGNKHDKNPDSLFGSIMKVGKDVYSETKKHFFGDKNSDDPDKKKGMMSGIANMLGDGMSEWSNFLFGTERDANKTGSEILRENTTQFVKAAPKGLLGLAGGAAAGAALAGGFGILGSFLFPGAPVALALTGGALGMATGFEGFNKWAFGDIGLNGERVGGKLISEGTRQFFKKNKSTLIGGAVGGAMLSVAMPAALSAIDPTLGAIATFFSPFGIVGSMVQGMTTAMVLKSESVLSFLFGAKDIDGKRVNGLMTRMFKGKNGKPGEKMSGGKKAGLIATGILGGMALGFGAEAALGSMGFIGSMLAGPAGPVSGAIAGLAAGIIVGSEKLNNFFFGKTDDKGNKTDSIFGKFNTFLSMNIFEPMAIQMSKMTKHTVNWITNKYIPAMLDTFEPVVRAVKEVSIAAFKTVKALTWDLSKIILKSAGSAAGFIAKQIGGAVAGAYETVFGTTVRKSLIDPILSVGEDIVDSLKGFGQMFGEVGSFVFKGLRDVGMTVAQIPGALSMGILKTLGYAKSAIGGAKDFISGTVSNYKERASRKNKGDGSSRYAGLGGDIKDLAKNTIGGAAIFARYKSSDIGQNEDFSTRRREAADSRYKENRDNINGDAEGKLKAVEEMKALYRTLGYDAKKAVMKGSDLEKFRREVLDLTGGLTLEEVLNSRKPIVALKASERKKVLNRLKHVDKGFTGDELRKKLNVPTKKERQSSDPAMAQVEVAESIYDQTREMTSILQDIAKGLSNMVNVDKLQSNSQDIANDLIAQITRGNGANAGNKAFDILANLNQAGQSTPDFRSVLPGLNLPTLVPTKYKPKPNKDESTGGAIGGAVMSATRSITSRVTGAIGGMTKEVSKLGCGAIVLAKVLMDAGIRMSANEIYSFAEERGLVQPGIGMSSDVFKAIASARGLSYAFAKANRQGLERLFKSTNMVIARLSTGVGHFVVLHSYSKQENNLAIDDPMGKIGGVYSLDQILSMATHLYAVYRRGAASNPLKSLMSRTSARATGRESSTGGAIGNVQTSGSSQGSSPNVSGIMNKLGFPSSLGAYIKEMGILPVLTVRSKEEVENERKLLSMMGGGSGSAIGNAQGVNRPGTMGNTINPFNLVSMANMLFGAVGLVGQGIGGLIGTHKNGGIRNATKSGASDAYGRAQTKAAEAQISPLSTLGSAIATLGRTVARPFRGGGNAGRRAIRAVLSGRSAAVGSKISQELVQMGDGASRSNMSSLGGGYQTTANAGLVDETGRLDINNFLKRQGEKMAAQAEANFRGSSVDLGTRIEINTRYTAQLLGELADSTNRFQDWLKDWLNNFNPCCPMPGGGIFPPGGGGTIITPPVVVNRKTTNNTNTRGPIVTTVTGPVIRNDNDTTNNDNDKTIVAAAPVIMGSRKPKVTKTGTAQPPATQRPVRTSYNPTQLPMPNTQGLPEPTTRRVRDVMTGEYVDLERRRDVIDVDHIEVNERGLPTPEDPTKKKQQALSYPQSEPVLERVPVGDNQQQQHRRTMTMDGGQSSSRGPSRTFIDAEWTPVDDRARPASPSTPSGSTRLDTTIDNIEQATQGRPNPSSAQPVSDNHLDRYLNQSRDEFEQARRGNIDALDTHGEDEIRRKFRNGEIDTDEYNKQINKHRQTIDGKRQSFDSDINKQYENIQKEKAKKKKPRRGTPTSAADAAQDFYDRTQSIGGGFDDLNERAASGGRRKPSKLKSFFKDAGNILMGRNQNLGIASGANAMDDIGKMLKNTGSKLFKGKKKPGIDAGADLAKKSGKKGILKTLSKGLGKTGAKLLGGAATGGALAAGMTALDAKYGYDNADMIMKKDPSEITKADRVASSTAQSVIGFVPLIDMADEMLGGHAKEWLSKLIVGLGPIWDNIAGTFSDAWTGLKEKVTAVGSSIVKSATEKWEGIKTTIGTKWDEAKTSVTTKLSAIVKSATDKWESIKTSISTKWDEAKTNVTGKLSSIVKSASTKWEEIKNIIPEKFGEVKDNIIKKLSNIAVSFTGLAKDIASNVKEKILSGIGSLKVKIFGSGEQISITGEKVIEKAKAIGKKAVDKTKEVGKKAANKVKDVGVSAWNKTKGFASKLMGQGGPSPDDVLPFDETYGKGCTDCKKKKKKVMAKGEDIKGAYFSQKDSRWSGNQLAKGASMGEAGCGPTAIANVVTDLTGQQVLPTEAAKFAKSNGYVDPTKGTDSDLFGDFAISKGVKVNQTLPSTDNIRSQLAMGNKVILRGEKGKNYTSGGHYIVADGIDKKGNISVKDPLGKSRSGSFAMKDLEKGLTSAFIASTTGAGMLPTGLSVFGKGDVGFVHPMPKGKKTSGFGYRDIGSGREFHRGIDYSTPGNNLSVVQASADGVVLKAESHSSYGNYIVIKHDVGREMTTVYAHLSEMKVGPGAKVKQGQVIGVEGSTGRSTGPHLHFEIHEGPYDRLKNTRDPEKYIGKNGIPTPAPFYGDTGDMSGIGKAAGALGAAWSLSNLTSKLSLSNFLPKALTNLPSAMEAMSNSLLFGAPVAGIAAALTGNLLGSNEDSSVPTLSGNENAEKVWNYFKSKGYSTHAIAGIMGNLQQESQMNPKYKQSGGTAQGIAQWEGGRWTNLVKKAKAAGVSEWDLGIQLKHITDELGGGDPRTAEVLNKTFGGLEVLKSASDYKTATQIFEKSFERAGKPMYEKRYGYAEQYYNKFNSTTGSGMLKNLSTEGVGGILDGDELEYNATGRGNNLMNLPKVTPMDKQSMDQLSAIRANGFGNIETIEAENMKYENVRASSRPSTSTTQVFAEGMSDAWSTENVERAIQALETIAGNTAEAKAGINKINNNFNSTTTVNGSTSNQTAQPKKEATQANRSLNENNVRRSKDIIRGRK